MVSADFFLGGFFSLWGWVLGPASSSESTPLTGMTSLFPMQACLTAGDLGLVPRAAQLRASPATSPSPSPPSPRHVWASSCLWVRSRGGLLRAEARDWEPGPCTPGRSRWGTTLGGGNRLNHGPGTPEPTREAQEPVGSVGTAQVQVQLRVTPPPPRMDRADTSEPASRTAVTASPQFPAEPRPPHLRGATHPKELDQRAGPRSLAQAH